MNEALGLRHSSTNFLCVDSDKPHSNPVREVFLKRTPERWETGGRGTGQVHVTNDIRFQPIWLLSAAWPRPRLPARGGAAVLLRNQPISRIRLTSQGLPLSTFSTCLSFRKFPRWKRAKSYTQILLILKRPVLYWSGSLAQMTEKCYGDASGVVTRYVVFFGDHWGMKSGNC